MTKEKEKDKELINAMAVVLKDIRKSRTLSQQVVYEETGIHVGRIELGLLNVSITTLSRLCKFYHVNLIDLFARLQKILAANKEAAKRAAKEAAAKEAS
jgi:transcriptional regulator with XRE-family HTH domain